MKPQDKKTKYYKCFDCNYPMMDNLGTGCPKCKGVKFIEIVVAEFLQLQIKLRN